MTGSQKKKRKEEISLSLLRAHAQWPKTPTVPHLLKFSPECWCWVTSQHWLLEGAAYSRSRLYGIYHYMVFWTRPHIYRNCPEPRTQPLFHCRPWRTTVEAVVLISSRGSYTDRYLLDIFLPRPSYLSSAYSPCLFFDEQPHWFYVGFWRKCHSALLLNHHVERETLSGPCMVAGPEMTRPSSSAAKLLSLNTNRDASQNRKE